MPRKYQVFVSSTYMDLQSERQAAVEAILAAGCIPAGMELFCANDESQWKVIQRWINDSDIFLLLLGGRYGSIEPSSGKSYTHLEYDYAVSRRMPHFSLVLSDLAIEAKVRALGSAAVERVAPRKYRSFRRAVTTKMVRFIQDGKDVRIYVPQSIAEVRSRCPLAGWVKADATCPDDSALVEENETLKRKNAELEGRLDKTLRALKATPCRQIFAREHEVVIHSIRYSLIGQRRMRRRACECTLGEVFQVIAPRLLTCRVLRQTSDSQAVARQIAAKISGIDLETVDVPDQEYEQALYQLNECGLLEHYLIPSIMTERGSPMDDWRLTQAGRSLALHQRRLRNLSRHSRDRSVTGEIARRPRPRRSSAVVTGHHIVIKPGVRLD